MNKNRRFLIASDVGSGRDGIGIELYEDDELVLEIFRDDSKKTRDIILYKNIMRLDLVEESIKKFIKEIPWEFQD